MTHLSNTPDRLSDYLPDPRRQAIGDIQERYLYFQGSLEAEHTTLAVDETTTQTLDEPMRIKRVQVGALTSGTVTVQVIADGRDIFDDDARPVSGGEASEATDLYVIPAGTVVQTVIEATSGVPAGTAGVVMETEPFVLVPQTKEVKLRGRDRLFPSRRRAAAIYNTAASGVAAATVRRESSGVGGGGPAPTVVQNRSGIRSLPAQGGHNVPPIKFPGGKPPQI